MHNLRLPLLTWLRPLLLLLLAGYAGAQAQPSSTPQPGAQSSGVRELPLLPAGQCMGLGYGAPSARASETVDSLWNLCHSKGLGGLPIHVAWSELEPEPGRFDLAQLGLLLQLGQLADLRPFLVLTTLDTHRLTLPADLVDPLDARQLADGRSWDDAALVERFDALLEEVLPLLVEYGGFYASVGQEVDVLLFDSPEDTGAYARFLSAARETSRRVAPKLALGTTVSWTGLRRSPQLFGELLEACDNVALTYFPLKVDLSAEDPELVAGDMAAMLRAVAPRPLLIQEYGYPSGNLPQASNQSSGELQRRFIERCFEAFQAHPRIRFASYAQLADWGPAELGLLQVHHNRSDPRFVEFLSSLGLSEHGSGQPKPAFLEFVRGLERLERPQGPTRPAQRR